MMLAERPSPGKSRSLPATRDFTPAKSPQCLINAVDSMGRRNTGPKSNLLVFQLLNSFESADSKKALPCLGLIEYRPKDQLSLKNTIGSTD
jgi:hypothetical protein